MTSISSLASSSQLATMRQAMFARMDADSSGTVSKDEFVNARPSEVSETQASDLYAKIDSSGTDALTEDQLNTGMEANKPDKADASSLSSNLTNELLSSLMQLVQQLQSESSSSSSSSIDGVSATDGMPSAAAMFSKMDTDSNGEVTKDEFIAARPSEVSEEQATSLYDSIDTEGTGSITETQFADNMKARRPSGPPPSPPSGEEQTASSSLSTESTSTTYDVLAQLLQAIKAYTTNSYSNSTSTVDLASALEATA